MGLHMRIDKLRPPAQVRREADRIVYSTEARGTAKQAKEAAEAERKRVEQERASAMNIALKQPHRGTIIDSDGNVVPPDDERWSTALGRFCLVQRLRKGCYAGGVLHLHIIREARVAKGLPVPGLVGEESNRTANCAKPACPRRGQSTVCICAAEAAADLATRRLDDAEALLRSTMPRAPEVIRKLVYDDLTPGPNNEDLARHCLYRLGVHYGAIVERDYLGEMRKWEAIASDRDETTARRMVAKEMLEKVQFALDKSQKA